MIQLLFNSTEAASEIAFMLRAEWDGCNGVLFHQNFDETVLRLAIELTETQFCHVNECYLLDRSQSHRTKSFINYALPFQGLPVVLAELDKPLFDTFSRFELFEVFSDVDEDRFFGPVPAEIRQDRQKYPHLAAVLKDEYRCAGHKKICIEYMHLVSGIGLDLCATYLYMRDLDVLVEFEGMEEDIRYTYYKYLQIIRDIEG